MAGPANWIHSWSVDRNTFAINVPGFFSSFFLFEEIYHVLRNQNFFSNRACNCFIHQTIVCGERLIGFDFISAIGNGAEPQGECLEQGQSSSLHL